MKQSKLIVITMPLLITAGCKIQIEVPPGGEVVTDAEGVYRLENTDTQIEQRGTERYTAVGDDVLSAEGGARWTLGFHREGWRVRTHTETHMRVDADYFYIRATLTAEEDGEPVYHDEWNISVPRHHV